MNKVYRVIWNASLGVWMAVSELAKSKTKTKLINEGDLNQPTLIQNNQKVYLSLKPLSLAILIVIAPAAVAGYEAGGGSTRENCTLSSNGFGSEATSIAINNENSRACAPADEGIAIGATVAAFGVQSTVIGNDISSSSSASQSVIIGSNWNSNQNQSTGKGGVAIGSGLTTTLDSPVANGQGSVALGSSGDESINSSLNGAQATGNYSAAIMAGAVASGTSSIAFGTNTGATQTNAVAIGNSAKATAVSTTALGNSAQATALSTTALGAGATASVASSVALGSNTTTTAATGTGYLTNDPVTNVTGVVSVGSATTKRRIQNVADGSAGKDAVNVDQLRAVKTVVDQLGADTAENLGGGASYNSSTGAVTNPTYNIDSTDYNNVGAALEALETLATSAPGGGFEISANGGTADEVDSGETVDFTNDDGNIAISVTDNEVNYALADDINVESIIIGDTTNSTTLTSTANGLDVGGDKVTNVGAGDVSATSTDVVIGQQLNTTNTNVTDATNQAAGNTTALGGGASYDPATDTYTAPTYAIGTTNYNNVGSALEALEGITDQGFNIRADGDTNSDDNVKLGETVDFTNDDGNIEITAGTDNQISYNLADEINVESMTATDPTTGNTTVVDGNGSTMT
ncbi:MAG: ESPR-type extended signal peptide-containing protein, partial [Pseudomonadota bacterium]|nr:ESPR-type extended signal peptide-containing protein [Pseudomonadota bacterium]